MAGSNFYCIGDCRVVGHSAGVRTRQLWGLGKSFTLSDPVAVCVNGDAVACVPLYERAQPISGMLGPDLTVHSGWPMYFLDCLLVPSAHSR